MGKSCRFGLFFLTLMLFLFFFGLDIFLSAGAYFKALFFLCFFFLCVYFSYGLIRVDDGHLFSSVSHLNLKKINK